MGCLGTLIVIACIVAFVVVLVRFPKQTVGCGIALVVVAVIAIAALIQHDKEQGERWKQREAAITISVEYSPRRCGEATPLSVNVRNGTSDTLSAVEMRLEAYRPGYSTDLLQSSYDEHTIKWDKILPPGQADTLCYRLPRAIGPSSAEYPATLEYRIGYKYPRFQ